MSKFKNYRKPRNQFRTKALKSAVLVLVLLALTSSELGEKLGYSSLSWDFALVICLFFLLWIWVGSTRSMLRNARIRRSKSKDLNLASQPGQFPDLIFRHNSHQQTDRCRQTRTEPPVRRFRQDDAAPTFKRHLQSFRRDETGTTTFLSILVICLVIGFGVLSIDNAHARRIAVVMQTATDAAAHAAILYLPDTDAALASASKISAARPLKMTLTAAPPLPKLLNLAYGTVSPEVLQYPISTRTPPG